MTQRIFIDRSRYESAQRCQRARWYGFHQDGMGIQSMRQPLPLAVGGSVHVGLAQLLRAGQALVDHSDPIDLSQGWDTIEDAAVTVALADFAQYENAIDAPDAEQAALTANLTAPSVALDIDAYVGELKDTVETAKRLRNEFDEYLFREQSALVEAMVRAYARRRLRPLLEQFEVLEVEREGEWKLGEIIHNEYVPAADASHLVADELWFMSRPDALLRDRESNQLYLLSYKTTGSWDIRKARDAEHDMQGMSEGIEIERRLAGWWNDLHGKEWDGLRLPCLPGNEKTIAYLRALDAPPRILAVRMEFLLKGERWKDKELSARFGVEMRSQKSHLIRAYEAISVPMRGSAGYSIGDRCWSWDYIGDDDKQRSLAWQQWKSRAVFEAVTGGAEVYGGVRAWIDALDDAAETMSGEDSTMGLPPRLLGYKCDAQAVGLTAQHPLDAVFIPPITVYRNSDDLRDMIEQMEHQERRIAEGVMQVNAATEDGERRSLLNKFFPQTRRACEYPTSCAFVSVCYGGEAIQKNPLDSGKYKVRIANHPQEVTTDGGKGTES